MYKSLFLFVCVIGLIAAVIRPNAGATRTHDMAALRCDAAGAPARMAKSDAVQPGASDWTVMLHMAREATVDGGSCSGALIGTGWAVTAAHCVRNRAAGAITLTADIGDAPQRRRITAAYCAEDDAADVALLRLATALPDAARVMALPAERIPLQKGDRAEISSWIGPGAGATRRHATSTAWITRAHPPGLITARLLEDAEARVCAGASGAPLSKGDGVVLGVLSGIEGAGADANGAPMAVCDPRPARLFYAPIAPHAGWMRDVMAACGSDHCD